MLPTTEQAEIVAAAKSTNENLMISAYAGCAKTTTLEMLAKALPEPGLALAFNVKIKKDMEEKLPGWTVMTLNGLGHRAWANTIGRRLEIDSRKLGKLITALGSKLSERDDWDIIRMLVTYAMQEGLVPSNSPYANRARITDTTDNWLDIATKHWLDCSERHVELARNVLIKSIRMGYEGIITYDEQIYLSACHGGVFPRFAHVLVDEAQDLSAINHAQVARTAAGRIFVAGDAKQAVYAFRGAHGKSIEAMRELRPSWMDLPLTTTFRCPKRIVERQQSHAPGFKAFHTNAEGVIYDISKKTPSGPDFGERHESGHTWSWHHVQSVSSGDIAILSRFNAQVVKMAFQLLRQGIACHMLGRDIGKSLVLLSKKILPNDNTPAEVCIAAITAWKDAQIAAATEAGSEEKVAGITDRAESLLAVLEGAGAHSAGELRNRLEILFAKDSGKVTLSTIHRAKGLEWDCVVHLDPWRIPSRHALRQAKRGDDTQLNQEYNLLYVCETRSRNVLILANAQDFVG